MLPACRRQLHAEVNFPAGQTQIIASLTGFQSGTTSVTVVAATTTAAPAVTLVSGSGSITGNVKSTSGAGHCLAHLWVLWRHGYH